MLFSSVYLSRRNDLYAELISKTKKTLEYFYTAKKSFYFWLEDTANFLLNNITVLLYFRTFKCFMLPPPTYWQRHSVFESSVRLYVCSRITKRFLALNLTAEFFPNFFRLITQLKPKTNWLCFKTESLKSLKSHNNWGQPHNAWTAL